MIGDEYMLIELGYGESFESDKVPRFTLKKRGWTDSMIKKLLPEPEFKLAAGSRSRGYYLWNEEDILKAEEADSFKDSLEKSVKRKESAKKAVETKKKNTISDMQSLANQIIVERVPIEEVDKGVWEYHRYKKHYSAKGKLFSGDGNLNLTNVRKELLNTWRFNHIRHCLTDYEYDLLALVNRVGKDDAYHAYREIIDKKIYDTYPELDRTLPYDNNHKYDSKYRRNDDIY